MKSWKNALAIGLPAVLGLLIYYGMDAMDIQSLDLASKKPKDKRQTVLGETKKSKHIEKETSALMNDPAIAQAWGLSKIDAARAWDVTQGSKKIVVAVIDTGCDIQHEDLKSNIWKNPGEIPGNGIDDDKNGFVDDVSGWNFVSQNSDLTDNHGHGTHIAGIIGAEAGNNKGIAGISPQVSLMCLKYFDPKVPSTDNLKNTVNAIQYAIKNGAHIINYSGGGLEFSGEEKQAIEEARQAGILFVAAAGNERSNSDHRKYYPADYGLSNIISVTAIDPSLEVLVSSNYGIETVDIAAPGQNILSTLPNNAYGFMTGTSQATAFVTGAAVLFMAHRQNTQPDEVKKYILATGDSQMNLLAKTRTSRKLNLFKAVTMLDNSSTASGLIATIGSTQKFSADPNAVNSDATRKLANFGESLAKKINAQSPTLRAAGQN